MTTNSLWIDRGLFTLRTALGVVFVAHGWQKLAVMGVPGLAGFLGQSGIPFPAVNAVLLIAVELGGGALLLAGAFTRSAALLIAGAMAVALFSVHLANGFFLPGIEYTFTLGLANLALVMTGAGKYSVDAWLDGRRAAPAHVETMRKAA